MRWILGTVAVLLLVAIVGGCSVFSWTASAYNDLIKMSERVDAQIGQVQNVYQRRNDLIPNVSEAVVAYAQHERETFTLVAEARAKAGQTNVNLKGENLTAENLSRFQQAQGELSGFLSRLLVISERYPRLKANRLFRDMTVQLEGTENRIAVERRRYNDEARAYNTSLKTFPRNLVAQHYGFTEKPYFTAEAGAEKAPKLNLRGQREEKK